MAERRRCVAFLFILFISLFSDSAFPQSISAAIPNAPDRLSAARSGQSQNGKFTYGIDLAVPQFRGLEPQLRLAYTSARRWRTRPGIGTGSASDGRSRVTQASSGQRRGGERHSSTMRAMSSSSTERNCSPARRARQARDARAAGRMRRGSRTTCASRGTLRPINGRSRGGMERRMSIIRLRPGWDPLRAMRSSSATFAGSSLASRTRAAIASTTTTHARRTRSAIRNRSATTGPSSRSTSKRGRPRTRTAMRRREPRAGQIAYRDGRHHNQRRAGSGVSPHLRPEPEHPAFASRLGAAVRLGCQRRCHDGGDHRRQRAARDGALLFRGGTILQQRRYRAL